MKPRSLTTILIVLPLALAAQRAHADAPTAQSLFYEARTLMQQHRYADACPKLAESLRLDPGIGTEFNLADCHEHVGKIATAWAGFLEAAAHSKAANQPEREKVARKRAQALESRLPKLIVEVPNVQPGLEVRRDGVVVGAAAFGTAIPVDPGTHRITASAPGKQTWETKVPSTEGKTARVLVPRELAIATEAVPASALELRAGAATPAPGIAPATTESPASFPPPIVEEPGSTQRTIGWVILGTGAAAVITGAAFGLSSASKRNDSRSHCVGDLCDATGIELRDDAIRHGNVATVSTVLGAAGLVGGIALVLTAPKATENKEERTGTIRAVPSFAQTGGGFLLEGAFQ